MNENQEPGAVPRADPDHGEGAADDNPPQVANTNRGEACDTTCWAMTLCLFCSLIGTIGAVVFFHFYNADQKALTRTCGEVTTWGEGYLKACLDKDHDRGSFHYCETVCKHL
ncbi:uncharacterized protein LOC142769020 isoform X2 [Rhipicephalus microplus]|uniref:uncharacterized protein LOC142769020 isoform X2 n=1 Tax=Rhipicephalus microplus TaxID=6941 RepID=UPI003F6B68FC